MWKMNICSHIWLNLKMTSNNCSGGFYQQKKKGGFYFLPEIDIVRLLFSVARTPFPQSLHFFHAINLFMLQWRFHWFPICYFYSSFKLIYLNFGKILPIRLRNVPSLKKLIYILGTAPFKDVINISFVSFYLTLFYFLICQKWQISIMEDYLI